MKLELIYFEGCPNAEEARSNVRRALDMGGVGADGAPSVEAIRAALEG